MPDAGQLDERGSNAATLADYQPIDLTDYVRLYCPRPV